jgi:hypothetical protein
MPASRPRQVLKGVGAFLLFMALGAVVGVASAHYGLFETAHLELTRGERLLVIPLLLVLFPLLILWHEIGHILGGRAVGFKPLLLIVGPFRWQKEEGRWKVSVNTRSAMAGGLAACVPTDQHDLARRTAALIAGGPLASFAGAVAGIGIWAALPDLTASSPLSLVGVYALLACFGFGNLLLGFTSIVPARTSGFYSDGARLLRIWRGGPELDREVALLVLTGMTIGGMRPRDWDPDLVRRGVGDADDSLFHVMGVQLALSHALDRGDAETSLELTEDLLRLQHVLAPLVQPALRLVASYVVARHGNDPRRARELLDRSGGGLLIDRHARHVSIAAVAWVEGNPELAARELDLAEAELPRAIDRGAAIAAADRIRDLRALLAQHTADRRAAIA